MKEKILAAHRGGVKLVLIPDENEKDLVDIPKEVKKDLSIISVKHMDEVISHAMLSKEPILKDLVVPDMPVEMDSNEKPLNLS